MCCLFFFNYANYSGIALGTKNMSGNFYLNIIILSLCICIFGLNQVYTKEIKSIPNEIFKNYEN